ncbi:IS3 family transposase [Companilactobacillus nantensis]|uniref:IS3 family transposase ISLasa5a n=1 Tax=Companilactobacillus nantensis DSM 16982 TaxID=1423774 RepID=A0A0R1W7S3_9LACO|nr:IS3 family transposase [Companilactobacillus nantensis]KRM13960.1 IS3 family transposase ISLasa5a [Companilactobacillus nantensis DSM 16982]GEO65579.1 transposase [Companilactobacillus nantensis]
MTKITIEKKIEIIEEYIKENVSKYFICKKYGINATLFSILVGIYKIHGKDKLINPPKITGESRVTLIKWKQDNHASISETCIHFAFRSVEAVIRWESEYNIYGPKALVDMRPGVKKHVIKERKTKNQRVRTRELVIEDTKRISKKNSKFEELSNKELSKIILELKKKYRLIDMIEALPIALSTFEYWQKRLSLIHPDSALMGIIRYVFNKNKGNYGVNRVSPRVRSICKRLGIKIPNHKKIQRLMFEMGLKCTKFSKRTRKYDSSKGPSGKKAKNVLRRRNECDRIYQKLTCDVTELKAKNGDKVYLELIKDLFTKKILEFEISSHPDLEFSLSPLKRLIRTLPETGYRVLLHTDQGWQYQHGQWRKLLKKGKIKQSMSRRATCLDNAACETTFNKLKAEIGPADSFATGKELTTAMKEWIQYYNEERIQKKLGYLSPLEFEQLQVA